MDGSRPVGRIFREGDEAVRRQPVLPWRTTLRMAWANMRNRAGRLLLVLLGVGVVVAFLTSSLVRTGTMAELARSDDVRVRAALERAGVFADDESRREQADREKWLVGLSCLLSVVVIANTMLMSVTERTSEIGTLKCLGALDRFIVRVFLVESLFVGLVGSVAGTAAGYLLTLVQLGSSLGFDVLSARSVLAPLAWAAPLALGAGAAMTVAAAVYPAYVAARMRPVDAMRAEV